VKPDEPQELLQSVKQGQAAERMLAFTQEYVATRQRAIQTRIFKSLEEHGYIEPLMATQAWIEWHTLTNLPKQLEKIVRRAQVAAEKIDKGKLA
jgi:predicted Zn-dependent peptidase